MKLPKKYRGQGRHLYCQKHTCKKIITSDSSRCKLKDVLARNCPFSEKHVYQSRIWNPISKRTDGIKSWTNLKDPEEFLIAHAEFKKELVDNDYNILKGEEETAKPYLLHELIDKYLDYLADIGVPEHEKKHRSKYYVHDEKRYLKVFLREIGKSYKVSHILITGVTKDMVAILYDYLNTKDYKPRTWNAHFIALQKFYQWLINYEGYEIKNPFKNVTKRPEAKDPQILEESEFEKMIPLITPENGIEIVGKKRPEKKQRYKAWLIPWFLISVLTGARRKEVALLKCKDVYENYIAIANHKVNNLENTNININYPPLTTELQELLVKLGVYDRDPEEFILCPERTNRRIVAVEASAGFKHFWKLTKIDKEVTLHNLRSTYVTRMAILNGEKGAGHLHKNIETAYKHYVSKKETSKQWSGSRLFTLNVEELIK